MVEPAIGFSRYKDAATILRIVHAFRVAGLGQPVNDPGYGAGRQADEGGDLARSDGSAGQQIEALPVGCTQAETAAYKLVKCDDRGDEITPERVSVRESAGRSRFGKSQWHENSLHC